MNYKELTDLLTEYCNVRKSSSDSYWIFLNSENLKSSQGWKIHVPFLISEIDKLYHLILKPLAEKEIPFKIPLNPERLNALNNGEYGEDQVGKNVTVYFDSVEDFKNTLFDLTRDWLTDGPTVFGEPRLLESSKVSFRYGDFIGNFRIGEDHLLQRFINDRDGNIIEDVLQNTFDRSATDLSFDFYIPKSIPPEGLFHILKENYSILKKNEKSANFTLLALSKRTLHKLTIKIVLKNHYNSEKLVIALSNEREALNDLAEKGFCSSPRVFDFQETDEALMLVTHYVDGKTFSSLEAEEVEEAGRKLVDTLQELHKCGYVHGDIKEDNIVWTGSDVYLIDFGAAGRIGNDRQLEFKTPGYWDVNVSSKIYDVDQDIFALKRVLFSIEMGCSVSFIKNDTFTLDKLYLSSPQKKVRGKGQYTPSLSSFIEPEVNCDMVVRSALDYFDRDNSKWFNGHEYSSYQMSNINIGSSGILLGLLRCYPNLKESQDYVASVIKATFQRLSVDDYSKNARGFFVGNAGVGLALVVGSKILNNDFYLEKGKNLICESLVTCSDFDLYTGLSGAIQAAIYADEISTELSLKDNIVNASERLLARVDSVDGFTGVVGSKGAVETGLAHGTCGIASAIGQIGDYLLESEIRELGVTLFKKNLAVALGSDGLVFSSKDATLTPNSIWCKGVGGALWAYRAFFKKDDINLNQFVLLKKLFYDGLLVTNPTMCHGMGGQLNLLNNIASDSNNSEALLYRDRLRKCLLAMMIQKEGKQYFLSENLQYLTPDLWLGFLGTCCALLEDEHKNKLIMGPDYIFALSQVRL